VLFEFGRKRGRTWIWMSTKIATTGSYSASKFTAVIVCKNPELNTREHVHQKFAPYDFTLNIRIFPLIQEFYKFYISDWSSCNSGRLPFAHLDEAGNKIIYWYTAIIIIQWITKRNLSYATHLANIWVTLTGKDYMLASTSWGRHIVFWMHSNPSLSFE